MEAVLRPAPRPSSTITRQRRINGQSPIYPAERVQESSVSGADDHSPKQRLETPRRRGRGRPGYQHIPRKKPFACQECGKVLPSRIRLLRHLNAHKQGPITCEVCGKSFSSKYNLGVHATVHTGVKPFQCKICSKRFRVEHSVAVHMKVHTKERLFKCRVCGKRFGHSNRLKGHLILHSQTNFNPFECKVCGLRFKRKWFLSKHLLDHPSTGPDTDESALKVSESWKCELCGREFKRAKNFLNHKARHCQVKNKWFCQVCGKRFPRLFSLRNHMEKHKKMVCEVCRKVFLSKAEFREHLKTHVIRDCKYCGKSFSSKYHYECHIVTHTKEKAFACALCNKLFGHQRSTHRHIVTVHERNSDGLIIRLKQDVFAATLDYGSNVTLLPLPSSISKDFILPATAFLHPNILSTYGVSTVKSAPFLVMEKVETTLTSLVREFGIKMTLRESVDLAFGVVSAVDYLHHCHGVVHGLLRSDCVFFTSCLTAKVLDPGAAVLVNNNEVLSDSPADDLTELGHILLSLFTTKSCGAGNSGSRNKLSILVRRVMTSKLESVHQGIRELLDGLESMRHSSEYLQCPAKRFVSCKLYESP